MKLRSAALSGTALSVPDFLDIRLALELQAAVKALPIWVRSLCLLGGSGSFEEVTEDRWWNAEEHLRMTSQDLARPLNAISSHANIPAHQKELLLDFLRFFVAGVEVRRWLFGIYGFMSTGVSLEFARYQHGDFLAEHSDLLGDRVLAMNIYLDDWKDSDGGTLGFRNGSGEHCFIQPSFNSVSLLPIQKGCVHWVDEWTRSAPGRETVCIGFDCNGYHWHEGDSSNG